jgi:phosphate/sulfate permease
MRDGMKRFISTTLRQLCQTLLRVMLTGLVFAACAWALSLYLGLPVPSPSDLLEKFKDVSRLAEILS